MPEFYYLVTKVIVDKYNTGARGASITINSAIENPITPNGVSVSGSLKKTQYVTNANSILNFINSNKKAPNYVSTALGKMKYQTSIYLYCKVLDYTYKYGSLPATVSISVASSHSMNKYLPTYARNINLKTLVVGNIPYSIYNEAYTSGSLNLNNYLVATKNCQVNDVTLKSLVKTLINGKTTKIEQANSIFNWVRDNVKYSYYFNTKYGAKGTYDNRVGNCVDNSHLLIALYRAAGLEARYINGNCQFNSARIGHTWTQVLIGDIWVVGDASSSYNNFGVINNWNSPVVTGRFFEITF